MTSKYHNHRSGGWDSKIERRRYEELRLLESAGIISNLRRQVPFELIPVQREPATVGPRGGLKPGKVIEFSAKYIADFVYEENGAIVVEDVKSPATRKNKDYILKRKLMLLFHGIRIREICEDKKKKGGSRYKRQTMARKSKRN